MVFLLDVGADVLHRSPMQMVGLTVNQGREERARDQQDRILSTVKRFADLSPTMYLHALAKLIIAK